MLLSQAGVIHGQHKHHGDSCKDERPCIHEHAGDKIAVRLTAQPGRFSFLPLHARMHAQPYDGKTQHVNIRPCRARAEAAAGPSRL